MNIQQHRARIIAESYGIDLEKGKKANIGEIREWQGKKFQKQANGEWKEVSEGGSKGNDKNRNSLNSLKISSDLKSKLNDFDKRNGYDQGSAEFLIETGFSYKIDPNDEDNYLITLHDKELDKQFSGSEYKSYIDDLVRLVSKEKKNSSNKETSSSKSEIERKIKNLEIDIKYAKETLAERKKSGGDGKLISQAQNELSSFLSKKYELEKQLKDYIQKSEYTDEQLKELVSEHENLIDVLESPSKSDDKKETAKQKKELKDYKDQLSKSEAYEILGVNLLEKEESNQKEEEEMTKSQALDILGL